MAIKVFGSSVCPGTMRFLSILTQNKVIPTFVNVMGSYRSSKDIYHVPRYQSSF